MSFQRFLHDPASSLHRDSVVGDDGIGQLWHALEGLDQGILVYDRNLTVLAFNARALEILDLPRDQFQVGGSFEDWVRYTAEHGGYGGEGAAEERAAHRLAIARSFEPLHTDQTRCDDRVIEIRGKPFPGGFVTTYTDVTERKRTEIALLRLAEKEAELNDRLANEIGVKNRLFSIIAHDLRSPFTSLLGRAETMSLMGKSASKVTLLFQAEEVHRSARQLFLLVESLLDWSRTQIRGVTFVPGRIIVAEAFAVCSEEFRAAAASKNIALEFHVGNETVQADPNMLQTILRNLVGNALKFTPAGGRVTVSTRTRGCMAAIAVADTGIGIPPRMVPDLFKVDVKTTSEGISGEQGTGFGLPLCAELVARNGGRIWVESAPVCGTIFRFSLPIARS